MDKLDNVRISDEKFLVDAFLALSDEEECKAFLFDLCSRAEIEEMSRRLFAAKMLSHGAQYADVVAETGLSTATISRVSRSLKNGNGYTAVLKKIK